MEFPVGDSLKSPRHVPRDLDGISAKLDVGLDVRMPPVLKPGYGKSVPYTYDFISCYTLLYIELYYIILIYTIFFILYYIYYITCLYYIVYCICYITLY